MKGVGHRGADMKAKIVSGVNEFDEITTSWYGWAGREMSPDPPIDDDIGYVDHYHNGPNRPLKLWAKWDTRKLRRMVKREIAGGHPSRVRIDRASLRKP